jgi:RimJ/RimL family protein N-acetyltransferase
VSGKLPQGERVDWTPARRPAQIALSGAHVLLRPLQPASDAETLFALTHAPHGDESIWTYLPDGPYRSAEEMREELVRAAASEDPLFCALVSSDGERPLGMAAYLRITPEFGVIEIGHIWFAAPLKRTTAATEAIFLLLREAFDSMGYRRVEWKCDALNAASRAAAERFGFSFEGVFRKHMLVKGRSRDTAWYAIVDDDWPAIRSGFEAWLVEENFDAAGVQKQRLSELVTRARGRR